jgi:nitrite reductase/ring-hydroxylating ferredoxin subunit
MLVRVDGHPYALAEHCSHTGWRLADGKLDGDCVSCPAHGSVFSIVDGAVRRGPAASPQAIYEVREVDGRIQVRSY